MTNLNPPEYYNYINGEWRSSESGNTQKSINPANKKEIVGIIPDSSRRDLEDAVAAAKAARLAWRKLAGMQRGNLLFKVADFMVRCSHVFGVAMTR